MHKSYFSISNLSFPRPRESTLLTGALPLGVSLLLDLSACFKCSSTEAMDFSISDRKAPCANPGKHSILNLETGCRHSCCYNKNIMDKGTKIRHYLFIFSILWTQKATTTGIANLGLMTALFLLSRWPLAHCIFTRRAETDSVSIRTLILAASPRSPELNIF